MVRNSRKEEGVPFEVVRKTTTLKKGVVKKGELPNLDDKDVVL